MTRKFFVSLCVAAVGLAIVNERTTSVNAESSPLSSGPLSGDAVYGDRQGVLHARIIATGIPGAGAVSEVGDFLRGSPLHDNSAFTPYTQPGAVLDPKRILVASTSNFGAPPARSNDPEGSILSIDPTADAITIPADFATPDGQASALDGAVQMYAAQSPAFLNGITEPQAVTSNLPSASLPLRIPLAASVFEVLLIRP